MRRLRRASVVIIAFAMVACSGTGDSAPEITAPPPTRASTPEAGTAPNRTGPTGSAAPTTETTTTEPPPTVTTTTTVEPDDFLPEDLGTPVDSAPGVDSPGEVVELMDNVWLFIPSEPDPEDANVIPPLPEDADIITAYARAQKAYHEQASMNPMPAVPTDDVKAALADGGTRLAENIFAPRSAAREHLDLTDGILLRPIVIADPRSNTEAFIFDCQFDGTVFVNSDGSLAEGQTPGVKAFPQIASVIKVDGEWIVERLTRDERACA